MFNGPCEMTAVPVVQIETRIVCGPCREHRVPQVLGRESTRVSSAKGGVCPLPRDISQGCTSPQLKPRCRCFPRNMMCSEHTSGTDRTGQGCFQPPALCSHFSAQNNWPECVGTERAKHKTEKRRQTDVLNCPKHSAPVKLF